MKKKINVLIIVIVVIFSFSFVSCEDYDNDTNLVEDSSVSEANDLNTNLLRTRSTSSVKDCDYWDNINPYYRNLRYLFRIRTVEQESNTFTFKVQLKAQALKDLEVYVKIYSPTGKCGFYRMEYDRLYFTYKTKLSEPGTYYYRYFVKLDQNKNELTKLHSDSKNFRVTSPSLPFTINHHPKWKHGEILGTVNGVEVRCNEDGNINPHGGVNQCTEFCHRYYNEVYGIYFSYSNACNWFGNITELVSYNNGEIRPNPGDILCMSGGSQHNSGHVAIIMEVGHDYIKIAQQNSGKSTIGPWVPIGGILSFDENSNSIHSPNKYFTIQGVMRKPA